MARLSIRRVRYRGDNWHYESPVIHDGLQILVGENGAGKTTFSNLIYFALGGRVTSFDRSDREPHREITDDKKNHVELQIEIDETKYSIKRFFGSNDIGVESPNGNIEVLPVTRNKDYAKRVFSDWMLERLGIEPVMLHHGTYSGKVNLSDLFRLIYHDQAPDPSGIFKKVDRDSFVTNSPIFRKAVFELLIGKSFQEYYLAIAKMRQIETERNAALQTLEQFKQFVDEVSQEGTDDANIAFVTAQIAETKVQLERATRYRASLQELPSIPQNDSLERHKRRLYELSLKESELQEQLNQLGIETARLRQLLADTILEATQIKKMMFAHDSLDLFSANTCPYCLNEVERVEGKCICGASVDEAAYERFFYDNADYLAILKTKQKNVETIQAAIDSCESERKKLAGQLASVEGHSDAERTAIRQATNSAELTTDPNALRDIDAKILQLRTELVELEQKLSLETKRQELEDKCKDLSRQFASAKAKATELEGKTQQEMVDKRTEFSDRYTKYLSETVKDVRSASIDDAYMPLINQGEYREASSNVAKRLMYYVSLFSMSLDDSEMAFPRFLLIDTPQTAGIDKENLVACIEMIHAALTEAKSPGQVILTIGPDRLPASFDHNVFTWIEKGAHLLIPTAKQRGSNDTGASIEDSQ